jgi:S-(hydroxymethyl)glutathione dehydrogenase/alcohol dehydrogenase
MYEEYFRRLIMKAVTFQGAKDIQVKQVEEPKLQQKDDIIVRVTSTAICGSDLHIYQGALPAHKDYVIGHEPMGIVEEVGPEVTKVKKGQGRPAFQYFLWALLLL